MAIPAIHKLSYRFDERNIFLHVVLGAIATLRRLRDPFRAYSRPAAGGPVSSDAHRAADDDDMLHLVLGLVSFSQSIVRHVVVLRNGAAGEATLSAAAPDSDPSPSILKDLLR